MNSKIIVFRSVFIEIIIKFVRGRLVKQDEGEQILEDIN